MRTTIPLLLGALFAALALGCGGSEPTATSASSIPTAKCRITPPLPAVASVTPEGPKPPPTARHDVTDNYNGVSVVDPYRWLEASADPQVAAWSDTQNAFARIQLDGMPERAAVKKRIAELLESQSADYFALVDRKGTLFALEDHPPKQQPYLVTLPSPEAASAERVIVDPNAIDPTGGTEIDFFVPSLDGKRVAVSLSKNGSERGDVHVYEVGKDTAKELGDVVTHVNNGTAGGSVAWNTDGSGFWYTRYPREGERPPADLDFFQQIYFHKLGTPATADT